MQEMPLIESLVKEHQMVRCFVLGDAKARFPSLRKGDSKTKVLLSMRQSLLNKGLAFKNFSEGFPIMGCVTSKEDHGSVGLSLTPSSLLKV